MSTRKHVELLGTHLTMKQHINKINRGTRSAINQIRHNYRTQENSIKQRHISIKKTNENKITHCRAYILTYIPKYKAESCARSTENRNKNTNNHYAQQSKTKKHQTALHRYKQKYAP